jgi:hypothetical protein
MGRSVGVHDLVSRGTGWVHNVAGRLESRRRRSHARRLARAAQRAGQVSFRRTWVEAEVAARMAVRSGVRIDDFLRARVARYAATLPVPLEELGIDVTVEGGDPVVHARAARPNPGTPRAADSGGVTSEIEAARVELATLVARVNTARARLDDMARSVAEELASGKLPAAPGQVEASLEQCGRPPVPHPAPHLLLRGLSFALLGSAAYRMATPALALTGLSTDDLLGAFAREPLSAAAGVLFGTGAAVSVYAFLNVAVERWHELLSSASTSRRPTALTLSGAAAVLLSTAVALAAIRPGLMAGPLLLVCVPLAAVLLLRQASRLQAQRAHAFAAALEWDRARAREAGERARRAEGIAGAERVLAAALDDHDSAEQRLRTLERRSAEEAREAELLSAEGARRLERLAEALAAALELDRYAFVRRSTALAREQHAVRSLRSRPAAVDSGVGDGLEAAG